MIYVKISLKVKEKSMQHNKKISDVVPICVQCKLLPTEFVTHKWKIRPNREICASCVKLKFLQENPEIVQLRNERREANRLKKEVRKKNREQFKNFFKNNPQSRAHYEEQQRKKREREKAYLKSEKGRAIYRDSMAKRRAKVLGALIELNEEERKQIKEFYRLRPEGYHVDHIIPLAKGGKHCLENLQYLKAEDNMKKNTKIDWEILCGKLEDGSTISVSWLMCKFKLSPYNAVNLMQHIKETYQNIHIDFENIYFCQKDLIKINKKEKITGKIKCKRRPKKKPPMTPRGKDVTKP